jgi:hypothetical protein
MMEHLSRYVQDVAMQLIAAHQAAIAEPKKDEDEKAKGQQKETFVEPMLELKEKFNRILRVREKKASDESKEEKTFLKIVVGRV